MGDTFEHERNQAFLRQFHRQEQEAAEARRLALEEADARLDGVREYNDAMAYASGLTRREYDDLLREHGIYGTQALIALRENPNLRTVKEALAFVHREAGDEAGRELVDPVGGQMNKKFPPRAYIDAVRKEYNAKHPRRKKQKGKGDVIERYHRWQAEQKLIADADASFDAFMASLQDDQE